MSVIPVLVWQYLSLCSKLAFRDLKEDECFPAGLGEANCCVVERAMGQETEDSLWGLRAIPYWQPVRKKAPQSHNCKALELANNQWVQKRTWASDKITVPADNLDFSLMGLWAEGPAKMCQTPAPQKLFVK